MDKDKILSKEVNNQKLEELCRKIDLQYDIVIKDIIQRFKSKDIVRISLNTGSSDLLDRYIDKRQKEVVSHCISDEQLEYVIDAGMGAGRWIDFFCNRSKIVIGIDLSLEMLHVARTNIKRKNANYIRCSITHLPFKENTFDLSFCCFSLLLLIREIDFNKAVKELIRVTKFNRKIIIIDITAERPLITAWTLRRTPSQYTKAFLTHGAVLKNVHGYYIDYPIRTYQFMVKKLLRVFWGSSQEFKNNFWQWLEKREGYLKVIVELPLKLIIFVMYPLDRLLAKSVFQPLCPEKVFVFEKNFSKYGNKKSHRNGRIRQISRKLARTIFHIIGEF